MLGTGAPAPLDPPSYLAYAERERGYPDSPEYGAARDFFRTYLDGAEPALFGRRAPNGARRSVTETFLIRREVIDRIRARGESPFGFVSAAISLYLSRVLRADEVILGVPVANRLDATERDVVGHFANTLPMRLAPNPDKTMREVVAEVRSATRALKRHERFSPGSLLRDLRRHGAGHPQLFDVTLSYMRWSPPVEIPGLRYRTVAQNPPHDLDTLAVLVNEMDEVSDVAVEVGYAVDVFDDDLPPAAVAGQLSAIIEQAAAAPDAPLRTIDMLSDAERHTVLHAHNDTATPFPDQATLPGLIAGQTARAPERVALVDQFGAETTYAELDAWTGEASLLDVGQHRALNADPPDHTRLRALIAKAFTMRRVERLRPVVERITDQLLDQIADQDQVDLMAAFCFPLPLMIIFELIGVPAEDREKFREWGERQGTPLTWAEAEELTGELTAYLEQLIAHKRAHPADDLLTGLIQARDNDDKLSDPELVGMTYLMIMAGFETTMNLLGNGLLTLLRHPDQLAEVRANPELLPQALEAYLRYDGPVVACMLRFTTGPVELRDVTIPADSFVLVNLTLANRDPERYADPDTFDIHRQIEGHLAFGHGVHYCIGAPLARMEGQVGIARLLERFPNLSLAVPPAACAASAATRPPPRSNGSASTSATARRPSSSTTRSSGAATSPTSARSAPR
ncbi:cytochrome P450 [Micromonospora sp. NPDC048830]|uniref:cytochrome P450 n=1 Tax=Micromonospora sp. NPDC048830 TaxID=3364257 RepID=UPI00371AD236